MRVVLPTGIPSRYKKIFEDKLVQFTNSPFFTSMFFSIKIPEKKMSIILGIVSIVADVENKAPEFTIGLYVANQVPFAKNENGKKLII